MGLKDILVHVDGGQANASRVRLALELAGRFQAHLSGLYVIPRWTIPPYVGLTIDPSIIQAQEEAARTQAKQTEEQFRAAADQVGIAAEWRALEGEPAPLLVQQARYADLVILGQANPDDPASPDFMLAEEVILQAGRPVLVVPYIGAPAQFGQRVLVAWNASRESTRAVNDALPLLAAAQKVDVVVCNAAGTAAANAGHIAADISLHLARHGVTVESHHLKAEDIEVGDMLLSRAADLGADLIVMGAYGHSRWRELVLGGATRHILKHMTVPVLMAH
ncbi:MAG TPA: universal stress protein [Candidatus Competibacteraceae bacterium]|nr:universal stress protein [Candidatus Competibacteraceae bacterium]